jgi:hypothetical protein
VSVVVTRAQAFCMTKIRRGRFTGFTCCNASPCYEHAVRPLALNLQAQCSAPDEYPFGFYVEMARQRLTKSPVKRKVARRASVLW